MEENIPRKHLFNDKQKMFCEEYIANHGNGLQAYLIAYKGCKYSTAKKESQRLLALPHIISHLEVRKAEIAKNSNITLESQIKKIWELFNTTESDHVKVKCLDMINDLGGLYKEKSAINVMSNEKITIDFGGYKFNKEGQLKLDESNISDIIPLPELDDSNSFEDMDYEEPEQDN